MILFNKYKLLEKINQGMFGCIYKGENIRTKEEVAIKIEKISESSLLKNEAKIYVYLRKIDGFPEVKWFGSDNKHTFLVMNLLGDSLTVFRKKQNYISINKIIDIGIQMFHLIKLLHDRDMIHRDIKPDNFLFGLETNQKQNQNQNQNQKLYLIDFGFCKRFKLENGSHIPIKTISNIIGTANYISLNVHYKIEPSRRDDLESIVYIMLFLFDNMVWANYTSEKLTNIIESKENILNQNIPDFFKKMITYIRLLKFDETPNYYFLNEILISSYQK
jgi:serine/threonine protein kinase